MKRCVGVGGGEMGWGAQRNERTNLDAVDFGRLEKDVSAEDVVLGELERVAKAVVHVGLRGEVHDGVDCLGTQDVLHKVGRTNVAFDKFVIW